MTGETYPTPSFALRKWLVLLLMGLALAALGARIIHLQILDDTYKRRGEGYINRQVEIPANRGMIRDARGEPLAISTPMPTIWVNPKQVDLEDEKWHQLAEHLQLSSKQLADRIRSKQSKSFMYLERWADPNLASQVSALKLSGLHITEEPKRFYPAGAVISHVVGFTDIDDVGQEGIELSFEHWLKGSDGLKQVLQDAKGHTIEELGITREVSPGNDLQLSLDLRLQYIAYRAVKEAVVRHQANSGSAVVIDTQTGKVLAMVNEPSFNPNDRTQLVGAALRNRAVTDVFEPGSTVKPFTLLAAMETGAYQPSTVMHTAPGWFAFKGLTIQDVHNYGSISLTEVITKSSNVAASRLALEIGREKVWHLFDRVGFGGYSGSDFPGESMGNLRGPDTWRQVELATLSFGYGLSVTALQLARAYAVLGNDGERLTVSLLNQDALVERQQVIEPKLARQMVEMMETVVSARGTAPAAAVPGYRVAGKTGTVKKLGPTGYQNDSYLSVFAGLGPVSEPRFATVVVIDEPRGKAYYGGDVAAPAFSTIMSGAFRLFSVTPDQSGAATIRIAAN